MMLNIILFVFSFIEIIECTEFEDMMREKSKDLKVKCMKEFNIDQGTLDDCHKGIFPENRDLKCYMKCIYEGQGLFSEDGMMKAEELFKIVDAKHHNDHGKQMENCDSLVGEDMCEIAFLTNKCYYETDPKTYFII